MESTGKQPPESPKEALAAYIVELERGYLPWYERSSNRWKVIWGVGQTTALLAGVLASVLAAAADEAALQRFGLWRTVLIVLPALGAFAASLLGLMRARELLALRERGRVKIQEIISRAKANYASAAGTPERLSDLHTALVAEVNRLENDQATDFLSLAPGAAASQKQQDARSTRDR
jgi:hypothetical protein